MVSLPFADHCEPLLDNANDAHEILDFLRSSIKEGKLKYVEIRPHTSWSEDWQLSAKENDASFCFHSIDLKPDLQTLFGNFQKSSIQRKIRRAEHLGLSCKRGRSEEILKEFYSLIMTTRRRHQLPPQPISWFRNLIACFGDRIEIRVAEQDHKPLAAMLTLFHKETLVYKYGGSDESYHHCGSMPFLFWDAIREAKQAGFTKFDLGRSDLDNSGLITFKTRLGARASTLQYVRLSRLERTRPERKIQFAKRLFACMPNVVLSAAGKLLYRHIG
jgi:hypothetical protein